MYCLPCAALAANTPSPPSPLSPTEKSPPAPLLFFWFALFVSLFVAAWLFQSAFAIFPLAQNKKYAK
jgi:hypothetical protein